MSELILVFATAVAVLASALVAGIFLAFSDFIMRSLLDTHPESGIEAMQIINRHVYRSIFMVLLMGMVPYSIILSVYTVFVSSGIVLYLIVAGSFIYIVGVVLLTGFYNVPMNQKLDAKDYSTDEAKEYWREYVYGWTRWNHIRTICSILAAILFLLSCVLIT